MLTSQVPGGAPLLSPTSKHVAVQHVSHHRTMNEVFSFPAQLDSEFPKVKYLIMFNINLRPSLAKYLEHKYLLDE